MIKKYFQLLLPGMSLFIFACSSSDPADVPVKLHDSAEFRKLVDSTKHDLFIIVYPDSRLTYRLVSQTKPTIGKLDDYEKIISDHHKKFPNAKILLSVPDCFEGSVLTQLLEKAKKENVKVDLEWM